VQRFLARKKVETERRLAARQGASHHSDFKVTGGWERAGSGGVAVVENNGAKYFYFCVTGSGEGRHT
jgi:hypothetical protein